MNKLFAVLMFCVCIVLLSAGMLYAEGEKEYFLFLEKGQTDSANLYLEETLLFFHVNDDLEGWLFEHRKRGGVLRSNGRFQEARQCYSNAIQYVWRLTKNDKEDDHLAWIHSGIGYAYRRLSDFKLAAQHYQKAADILVKKLKREDDTVARYIYSELGNAYGRLGEHEKAVYYLNRRIDILSKYPEYSLAGAYNDLAVEQIKQREYKRAIQTTQIGLKDPNIDTWSKILLYTNCGLAHYSDQNYEQGLAYTRKGELLAQSIDDIRYKNEALMSLYENYAKIYAAIPEYERSEKYYNQALTLAQGGKRNTALFLLGRAKLYQKWNKPKAALQDFHSVLQLFIPAFQENDNTVLPFADQLYEEPYLVMALAGKGQCFMDFYATSNAMPDLYQAEACFDMALQAEELLIQYYTFEGSRFSAIREHRYVREHAMHNAYTLWQKAPSSANAQKVFNLCEQNRALILFENMQLNASMESSFIQDSLRSAFLVHRSRVIALAEQVYISKQNGTKHITDSLNNLLIHHKEQKSELGKKVMATLAQKTQLALNSVSITDVQKTVAQWPNC